MDLVLACSDNNHSKVVELIKIRKIRDRINDLVTQEELTNLKWKTPASKLTALKGACIKSNLNILNTLLDSGARSDIANDSGFCAIHYACRSSVDALEKVKS